MCLFLRYQLQNIVLQWQKNKKNTPQRNKRELFMERLKTKYPDDNFDDEEVLYGRLGED